MPHRLGTYINKRLLVASFRGRTTKLSVVRGLRSERRIIGANEDLFYNQLQAILDGISSSHMTVLLGDMNAKVGSRPTGDINVVGTHGPGVRNDNGSRFVD